MSFSNRWLWLAIGAAVAVVVVAAILIIKPWSTVSSRDSADTSSEASAGIVATVPEPTATDDRGLPIPPSDPFMPPPDQQPGNTQLGQSSGQQPTLGPGQQPTPGPAPQQSPPTPTPPSPPPINPPVPTTDAIACQALLQPGPDANTVRLVVRSTANETRTLWVRVKSRGGQQEGTMRLSSGYGEQIIPGLTLVGTQAAIYADPAMTGRGLSCTAG